MNPLSARETPWLNHCEVSPWVIASVEFNAAPQPLRLVNVRETNRRLFAALDAEGDPAQRGQIFHEYISVKFALHHWNGFGGKARRSLRNSYLRFISRWGVNACSPEGAVLKAWVQSRFGIVPTYHRKPLPGHSREEDLTFARDRLRGSTYTNAIEAQLDLVYEFCQYELARRAPGTNHLTLYRGTYDPHEHPLVRAGKGRTSCLRLNNLCSFTSERERAWEFGSTVWRAEVPVVKVVFFSGLFSDSLLRGEEEIIVIGGEYWVEELLY